MRAASLVFRPPPMFARSPVPAVPGRAARLAAGLVLAALVGCKGALVEVPRVGGALTREFGQPPLVHTRPDDMMEVIFPEEMVRGADSATRHDLAWRVAQFTRTALQDPERVARLEIAYRERRPGRGGPAPREERYVWSMDAVARGDRAAVDGPRNTPPGAAEMGSMSTAAPEPGPYERRGRRMRPE